VSSQRGASQGFRVRKIAKRAKRASPRYNSALMAAGNLYVEKRNHSASGCHDVHRLFLSLVKASKALDETMRKDYHRYFGIERQLNNVGHVINDTTYAVNNVYLNGVHIAVK
jgi:hypothetical protein